MPSHRADTAPPSRRPRANRISASAARPLSPVKRPRSSLSAPQVGIAGALGIATIAAPISGAMANPMPKAQVNQLRVVASAPIAVIPGLPNTSGIGVKTLSVVPTLDLNTTAPVMLAAPRTLMVSRASRAGERSVLPGCDGINTVPANAANGELPATSLCTLWNPKHRLRADAAVALAKLNIAYKQHFGNDICLTDSYRSLSEQIRLRALKPGLAAVPGTSEHGMGLAVDLCDGVEKGSGSRFEWLRANAGAYGWANPDWAHADGDGAYEPWHWEYVAGEKPS